MEWYESIRKRPGMYAGALNQRGIFNLFRGIFLHSIDIWKSKEIVIELEENRVKISVLFPEQKIEIDWGKIKFNDKTPIDIYSLVALSSEAVVSFKNENNSTQFSFEKGKLLGHDSSEYISCRSCELSATLDREIWGQDIVIHSNYISNKIQELAYLHSYVAFHLHYPFKGQLCKQIYHFENGLLDKLEMYRNDALTQDFLSINHSFQSPNFFLEFAYLLRHHELDQAMLQSYVNSESTIEHGTHVDGLLEGIVMGIKATFDEVEQYRINTERLKKYLLGFIHVKIMEAEYAGSVKNKLINAELKAEIAEIVSQSFISVIKENEDFKNKFAVIWD